MNDKNQPIPESNDPEESLQVISILKPDEVNALGGLPQEAIVGLVPPDPSHPGKILIQQFRLNPAFIRFMHHIIKTFGPNDPSLQAAAAQQKNGWIYIIDMRTPDGPQGQVPPEDIIGAFEVKQAKLDQDTYWANENHLTFSIHGLVQLPPFLRDAFIQELKRLQPGQ